MSTGQAKLYTIELGQHRCITLLRELSQHPLVQHRAGTGCSIFTGRLTGDGYWQIQRIPTYYTRESRRSGTNNHRAYYVHRIAFVALHGRDIQQTGSHLCGNSNCFNPYHIVDEPQAVNNSRQGCLGFIVCDSHLIVLHRLCQHDPPCIKPIARALQCCLDIVDVIPDSQKTPPPITGLPVIQHMQQFLDSQHTLPDSQFRHTSAESAQDSDHASQASIEEEPSQASVGAVGMEEVLAPGNLPSSSSGPDYAG